MTRNIQLSVFHQERVDNIRQDFLYVYIIRQDVFLIFRRVQDVEDKYF